MAFPLRSLLTASLLILGSPGLHAATPASGSWTEKTQEMAGGLVIRNIQSKACYGEGKSGAQAHLDRLAQRLIDSSCTSEAESKLDDVRFAVRCGGDAFGDGTATISANDDQSMRIDIIFHNNATGLDMEYQIDASWQGSDCHGGR